MAAEQIGNFVKSVITNPNLEETWLNLSSLNMGDNEAMSLKAALSEKNNNIKVLNLSQNKFKETGIIAIFQSLLNTKLDTFIIDGCLAPKTISSEVIGKRIATSLFSLLSNCPSIKTLSMSKSYDGRVILPLLENLAVNTTLIELDISENKVFILFLFYFYFLFFILFYFYF